MKNAMKTYGRNGPLVLRTYGKHMRKVETWLTPDNRRKVFSSTSYSDLSASTEDSSLDWGRGRKCKVSTASARPGRRAKRKALAALKDNDSTKENIPVDTEEGSRERARTEEERKKSIATKRPHRISRKRALTTVNLCLSKSSSSDESRTEQIAHKAGKGSRTASLKRSDDSLFLPPSFSGKFVTNRRKGLNRKPQVRKTREIKKKRNPQNSLNSSDDFVAHCASKRRRTRRKDEFPSEETRSELCGTFTSFGRTTDPLKEVSLNGTADSLLRKRCKKPLLASTPSAASYLGYRPGVRSAIEISLSNDECDVVSPWQKGPGPAGENHSGLKTRPSSISKGGLLHSGRAEQPRITDRTCSTAQYSAELFSKDVSCSALTTRDRPGQSDSSLGDVSTQFGRDSQFVSAQTHLDSVIEAVKERCRTSSPVVLLVNTLEAVHLMEDDLKRQAGDLCSPIDDWVQEAEARLSSGLEQRNRGSQASHSLCGLGNHPCEALAPRIESALARDGVGPSSVGVTHRLASLRPVVLLTRLDPSEYLRSLRDGDRSDLAHRFPGKDVNSGSDRGRGQKTNLFCSEEDVVKGHLSTSGHLARTQPSGTHGPPGQSGPAARRGSGLRRRLTSSFSAEAVAASSSSSDAPPPPRYEPAPSPARRPRPGKRRTQAVPREKPGTGRKAGVSGLSVSRWAKRDLKKQHKKGPTQSLCSSSTDYSLADFNCGTFLQKHRREPVNSSLDTSVDLGTKEQLGVSSLLLNFTPGTLSTQHWSRLKAALSVHKKKTAIFTPKKLNLSHPDSVGRASHHQSPRLMASPLATPRSALLRDTGGSFLNASPGADDITDEEKVLQECRQSGPIAFEQCIPPSKMKACKKIGEGTFGEVFSTTNECGEPVALKIIPIAGDRKVNGEHQKTFGEILHEVIISKELSSLSGLERNSTDGFITLNNLHCVRGSYPELLLKAWDKFDKQKTSENDRPDFFEEDQIFLILEFEFGGSDLENLQGKLSSVATARSILHQVTAALAVAEQALCFEHRDLHWGNILVKSVKEKEGTFVLNGTAHSFETKGVHVNIIDYSLSRLEIDGLTVSCDISSDEELFMGSGDYQFDIYRKMREENNNSWAEFHPHSNVLWLHYLSDKLLNMSYKTKGLTRPMSRLRQSIADFHRHVLRYESATDALRHSGLFQ
ncbi:uncharacterized protein haspin isoform X2 [Amia ocellicauda]|uniref:uncharacterized protein haspin isoform X2 n=1 Tax=Amia ocellicauda TaxID=2972642 RepID=UPI003463A435